MDYYVSEFNKNMESCVVLDYAVYMQKHTGFARFNPFACSEQLVVYLTEQGCYCCRVQDMGQFTLPVTLERAGLQISADGKRVCNVDNGNLYAYIRKWKDGKYASCDTFAAAAHTDAH